MALDGWLLGLGVDLTGGLEVLPAAALANRPPAGDLPLLVTGVAGPLVASVQAVLVARYDSDHPVTLRLHGQNQQIPLHELDKRDWADYETSLYLPPCKPSEAGDPNPRRWVPALWPADPLVAVMAKLRAPDGCPWDREMTHQGLRKYMLEEAYEAVEAIDGGDPRLLCEELGDVLLQVVFHAQIAREAGTFDFRDVVESITAKLVRRHPHVFGEVVAETPEAVTANWEAIKRAEKGGQPPESVLGKVSGVLPALSRAHEIQKRAAKVGFDWESVEGPAAKVREELAEVLAAAPENREGEVGDLLFAVVNLARMLKIDPEVALSGTIAKFVRRFSYIERRAVEMGYKLETMTLVEMDRLWDEAKQAEFTQKCGQKYPNT